MCACQYVRITVLVFVAAFVVVFVYSIIVDLTIETFWFHWSFANFPQRIISPAETKANNEAEKARKSEKLLFCLFYSK